MRIAVFTESWIPMTDGLTTSLLAFKRELESRGHHLHVFAPGPEATHAEGETRYKGYPFWGYPELRVNFSPSGHDTTRLLIEGGFDIVHLQSPGPVALWGLLAAKRLGLPVVTSYHTFLPDLVPYVAPPGLQGFARSVVWSATERFFRATDLVLVPGPSAAAEILAHMPIDAIPRMEIQPNGVDVARFRPDRRSRAMRERLSPNGEPVVLSVSRLAREKNIPFLVDALVEARKTLPDLTLAIGGRGPERETIERRARRLGVTDAVRFLGYIADEDLAAAYASADAFASASAFETQGMTAIEAMACGTPVAAARARGLADYVRDGETGHLFTPGDLAEAARAMTRAVAAGDRMRNAARQHAMTLSVARATDLLEKRYHEVANTVPVYAVA
ncbi:MAG TPA: glycosyltransferase [Candidatus Thermoplasmatota archaeon]|nr:glycosyltransferase [Candidatus Thermoplasmatota archaeon]